MPKAIIIGGGVIGLFSAFYLRKSGFDVTVLDKGNLSNNCSGGNAGMIVPSHFVPLAAPGMVEQGIRWMFSSKSPFYVRPSLNPDLIDWGLKFLKSATSKHVEHSAQALKDLSLFSFDLYRQLSRQTGFGFDFEHKGILMLYKTEKVGAEENQLAQKARRLGLDAVELSRGECQALQPQLQTDVLGAVHYRCDAHLNPGLLIKNLLKQLEAEGVRVVTDSAVVSVEDHGRKITKIITASEELSGDVVVLAGGSWSPLLAKKIGLKLPLMPGKGYSFMAQEAAGQIGIPALLCEARVSVTPMDSAVRFGGTMEIDRINTRINMKRVQGIVESVNRYFPGLNIHTPPAEKVWYGFRPCSPDGLPYIGRTKKFDNLIVATGHGMMGLSLAPATGKLVSDLANGRNAEVDIGLFTPQRFG